MNGVETCLPELNEAILDEPAPKKNSRTLVWPGQIKQVDNKTHVTLAGKRSSAALSALLGSDGLIFISQTNADTSPLVKAVRWQQLLSL